MESFLAITADGSNDIRATGIFCVLGYRVAPTNLGLEGRLKEINARQLFKVREYHQFCICTIKGSVSLNTKGGLCLFRGK